MVQVSKILPMAARGGKFQSAGGTKLTLAWRRDPRPWIMVWSTLLLTSGEPVAEKMPWFWPDGVWAGLGDCASRGRWAWICEQDAQERAEWAQ